MRPSIDQYMERIGYEGSREPTLETLRAIHRHQALSIPYENLDVYLETPVDRDMGRIFTKIVERGRGGWCYEVNGLFGWALEEMGYGPVRHCGAVMRDLSPVDNIGGHLVHTVELGGPWLVDVGLGIGILEPVRLTEGGITQGQRSFRLEHLADGFWRFHNSEGILPPSFDFRFEPADDARLDFQCDRLQRDPMSLFRQNLICQVVTETGFKSLVGRTLTDTDAGIKDHLIASEDELHTVIEETFGINPPNLDGLWSKVVARHAELVGGGES